jgi:hypothetical protein
LEKLLIESTRTGEGPPSPVESVLKIAKAAREELTRRGVKLEEIGYTREQWSSKIVDSAVKVLHQYCMARGSDKYYNSFKRSQELLNAVNRRDPGMLILLAGPASSEGVRVLETASADSKDEHTYFNAQDVSHTERLHLSAQDPNARVGLLKGQYIEEHIRHEFLEQAGIKVDKGSLEDLRIELMKAEREHMKQYGGSPVAILSQEQKELVQNYKEINGTLPDQVQDKLQDGLVIGESRADSRLERELVHEHVREFIEVFTR